MKTSFFLLTGSRFLATSFILFLISHFSHGQKRESAFLSHFEFGIDRRIYSDVNQWYTGSTHVKTRQGKQKMLGVAIEWQGSILGNALFKTDKGLRIGELLGIRLDQGPAKRNRSEVFDKEDQNNINSYREETSYYGKTDLDFGITAAYRVNEKLDIWTKLYYEVGVTFGAGRSFDHGNKIIAFGAERNRWMGEIQYGAVWKLSKVEPYKKFKLSARWYVNDLRKFYLAANYERLACDVSMVNLYSGYSMPAAIDTEYRMTSFQLCGGIRF